MIITEYSKSLVSFLKTYKVFFSSLFLILLLSGISSLDSLKDKSTFLEILDNEVNCLILLQISLVVDIWRSKLTQLALVFLTAIAVVFLVNYLYINYFNLDFKILNYMAYEHGPYIIFSLMFFMAAIPSSSNPPSLELLRSAFSLFIALLVFYVCWFLCQITPYNYFSDRTLLSIGHIATLFVALSAFISFHFFFKAIIPKILQFLCISSTLIYVFYLYVTIFLALLGNSTYLSLTDTIKIFGFKSSGLWVLLIASTLTCLISKYSEIDFIKALGKYIFYPVLLAALGIIFFLLNNISASTFNYSDYIFIYVSIVSLLLLFGLVTGLDKYKIYYLCMAFVLLSVPFSPLKSGYVVSKVRKNHLVQVLTTHNIIDTNLKIIQGKHKVKKNKDRIFLPHASKTINFLYDYFGAESLKFLFSDKEWEQISLIKNRLDKLYMIYFYLGIQHSVGS